MIKHIHARIHSNGVFVATALQKRVTTTTVVLFVIRYNSELEAHDACITLLASRVLA